MDMLESLGIEQIGIVVLVIVFLVLFIKRSVITNSIGMKHAGEYQQYGMTAQQFFDKVTTAFQNEFQYPFDRECPNYFFAKLYDADPRYVLVIDLGNSCAAAIINEFRFPPKDGAIQFADERTNRTENWLVGKKFYIYRDNGWEMVSELDRNDVLDMLAEWGMESEIDLEHAYALSYPNAGIASKTEKALCVGAARRFALEAAKKAGVTLHFQEEQGH